MFYVCFLGGDINGDVAGGLCPKQCTDVIANNISPPYPNTWPIPIIPTGYKWRKNSPLLNFLDPDNVMIVILGGCAGFHTIANYNYETVLLTHNGKMNHKNG